MSVLAALWYGWMLIGLCVGIIALRIGVHLCGVAYHFFVRMAHIPTTPYGNTFLGIFLLNWRSDRHVEYLSLHEKFGSILRFHSMIRARVQVSSAKDAERVLKELPMKSATYDLLLVLTRGYPNLLSARDTLGDLWKTKRKTFRHSFSANSLASLLPVFTSKLQKMCDMIDKAATTDDVFEIQPLLTSFTLDFIFLGAFHRELGCMEGSAEGEAVRHWLQVMFSKAIKHVNPLFKLSKEYQELKECSDNLWNYCAQLLASYRKDRKEQGSSSVGVQKEGISILESVDQYSRLEGCSDELAIADMINFMIGGHESTSLALCWFLECMARNPQCCDKACAEIDALFSNQTTADVIIDGGSVLKLPYLNACIKESMRRHPTIQGSSRVVTDPQGFKLGEYNIPQGTTVFISFFCVNNYSGNFDDPLSFKPERWLDDGDSEASKRQPLTFSLGARNCLGQHLAMIELRLAAANLLRRFRFELEDLTVIDEGVLRLTLAPSQNLRLRITKRFTNLVSSSC